MYIECEGGIEKIDPEDHRLASRGCPVMTKVIPRTGVFCPKIVNEYDQEIPQSQTADNPVAPSLTQIVDSFSCPSSLF